MRHGVAWVVALMALALFGWWYVATTPQALNPREPAEAADFPNYYFGGERLRLGRPIYDPLEPEIIALFGLEGYTTYPADPPSTIALLAPLSFLGYRAAWYTWSAISMMLLVGSLWAVAREVGYSGPWAAALSAVALLTTPARFLFRSNHMESLLLALGVAGWLAWRRRRWRLAAVGFGVAAALKFFPGMWLLGLLRSRPRAGLVGIGVAAAALLVGGAITGVDNSVAFTTDVVSRAGRWYGTLGNYSLLSFGHALAGGWLGWLLLAVGAGSLLPAYLARPPDPDRVMVEGTAAALLLSPLSWLNYLVLVLPALLILSCRVDWRRPSQQIGFVALMGGLVFWGPVVLGSELASVLVSFVPTYALVALFFVGRRLETKEQAWSST